jgi:hypothetical protein
VPIGVLHVDFTYCCICIMFVNLTYCHICIFVVCKWCILLVFGMQNSKQHIEQNSNVQLTIILCATSSLFNVWLIPYSSLEFHLGIEAHSTWVRGLLPYTLHCGFTCTTLYIHLRCTYNPLDLTIRILHYWNLFDTLNVLQSCHPMVQV